MFTIQLGKRKTTCGGFELGSLGVPLLLISLSHGGGCPGRKVHSFNTPFASPPPAVGESDSPHPPPPLFLSPSLSSSRQPYFLLFSPFTPSSSLFLLPLSSIPVKDIRQRGALCSRDPHTEACHQHFSGLFLSLWCQEGGAEENKGG